MRILSQAAALALGFAAIPASQRLPDGGTWTTQNLNVHTAGSFCYDDAEANCARYGRLYTWEAAQQACQSLGAGWRLPTDSEWRQLARHFGGVVQDSSDRGRSAFEALRAGGRSGFNAVLGGGREGKSGVYRRLQAHGFYWTASGIDAANAWFYNFASGSQLLNRHEGEKDRAFSVRCVKSGGGR